MKPMSDPIFEVKKEAVIAEGCIPSEDKYDRDIEYIIYWSDEDGVCVNANYEKLDNGNYRCNYYYDRDLCETRDEYRKMNEKEIEKEALFSYIDGIR